ncbi:DUF2293 domain-containing protein [Amycolatopsis sp. H20-H5]|uniref:DUF2293 domain-containing protein n=1 Tax=Amycolatopsis sp. H20-H5 TaxID=3046309 RepID=UPI002DBFE372|nr:DUF2293 domain-containing protein [Amycolatopsis sp. H20-H5]MEC3978083.1 DUF2293 domain-containing protein [Amycolatopsis sp. H20-H5]
MESRNEQRPKLRRKVIEAAEAALAQRKYVVPLEVLTRLRWVPAPSVERWRTGRTPHLEGVQVDEAKLRSALSYLRQWAHDQGLQASEAPYVAATRDRRQLRFTARGDDAFELAFRTHWVSPGLSEKKREQIEAKQSKAPDLVVVAAQKAWICDGCDVRGKEGEYQLVEDLPLCLACADFDHLVFLPAGNAAMSRRAKSESGLSALVMEFNRRRKRYQRLGVLVEQAALESAEQKCLADSDVRAIRRVRDAERRSAGDVEFQAELAAAILAAFPGCPAERAQTIAVHAGTRGSGRVGRSAAGQALDGNAVRAAVVASVRHLDTPYDELLMSGVPRTVARDRIREGIDRVLDGWTGR